jgi:hypothetical protein
MQAGVNFNMANLRKATIESGSQFGQSTVNNNFGGNNNQLNSSQPEESSGLDIENIDWDMVKDALESPTIFTMEKHLDALELTIASINENSNPNAPFAYDGLFDDSGLTLLHLTVLHGSTDKVKLLLTRAK